MTRKQKAVKGLLILAAVLIVCMFFAKTVQTITTPKIRRIKASRGKLEEILRMPADVEFTRGEDVYLPDAEGLGVTVTKLKVQEGAFVRKGDLILETVAAQYRSRLETLLTEYKKASNELTTEKAGHIRLQQESRQNELYNEMLRQSEIYTLRRVEAMTKAHTMGLVIAGNLEEMCRLPLPENADKDMQALIRLINETVTAKHRLDEASRTLKALYNGLLKDKRVGDGTFDYIKKKDGLERTVREMEGKILALAKQKEGVLSMRAPHDGYITKMSVKAGDTIDGVKSVYAISPAGELPQLKADITQVRKPLKPGARVTVEGLKKELKIDDIKLGSENRKFALIRLTADQITELGGLKNLMLNKAQLALTYRADKATTLLPASALRMESGNSYYVFSVERNYSGMLGNSEYYVKKYPVTVIEKSDKMVSLQDEISYLDIADHEDRSIKDGQAVMDYVD